MVLILVIFLKNVFVNVTQQCVKFYKGIIYFRMVDSTIVFSVTIINNNFSNLYNMKHIIQPN